MALVIVGGLLTSTIMNLLLIPPLYRALGQAEVERLEHQ
jgi:Cu/Ag efflux pump CusA